MCNVPEPLVPDTSTSQATCPSPKHTPNPLLSPCSSLYLRTQLIFNSKTSVPAPALVLEMRPTLLRRRRLQPVTMPPCSAALNAPAAGHVAGKCCRRLLLGAERRPCSRDAVPSRLAPTAGASSLTEGCLPWCQGPSWTPARNRPRAGLTVGHIQEPGAPPRAHGGCGRL